MTLLVMICSWSLQQRHVRVTSREFDALNLCPFLKIGVPVARKLSTVLSSLENDGVDWSNLISNVSQYPSPSLL